MVTLLKSSVSGLAGRFGVTTASSVVKPSVLRGQRLGERCAGRSGLRPDDQVDVSNLVAIADERFTDEEIRGHTCLHLRFGKKRKDLSEHSQLDEAKSEPALERRGGDEPRSPARQRVALGNAKSRVEATSMFGT